MRQYLLPKDFSGNKTLALPAKESRYLIKVLRYRIGERFNGIDGQGNIWDLTLCSENTLECKPAKDGKAQKTSDTLPSFNGPYPPIHLFQCLCKGKKDESIVRCATEMGVFSITFVQSKFCTVDLSEKNGQALKARNERLGSIIKEAIQQSGSPIPTRLTEKILSIPEMIEQCKGKGLGLFFHQSKLDETSLSLQLKDHPIEKPVFILIGSEGGLSDDECKLLLMGNFHPVLLKTNILRAETAAIYALVATQTLITERLE
ncbi:MAG: RsmE family RNA methyltransferase [Sphaerochaetaceae bacterium]